MSKPKPLRKGDIVVVTNPKEFIRCGYPLTPLIASQQLVKDHKDDIIALLDKLGIPIGGGDILSDVSFADQGGMRALLRALGYLKVGASSFGGKDRSIYSEYNQALDGAKLRVIGYKQVMTGIYYPPSGGYSAYSGDYDYSTGGLSGAKSNRILQVEYINSHISLNEISEMVDPFNDPRQWDGLWIEANNCSKIIEEVNHAN